MLFDYIFIGVLIIIIMVNLIKYLVLKVIELKVMVKNVQKKKNVKTRSRLKLIILKFYIISAILKPLRVIPFIISMVARFIWIEIKKIIKFLSYFLSIRNKNDLLYVTLTEIIFIVLILYIYVLMNRDYIIKSHNLASVIIVLIFIGAMLIFLALFIVINTKQRKKNDKGTSSYNLIVALLMIPLLVFPILAIFEGYKNTGIKSTAEIVLMIGLMIYVVIILLTVLKNILDRGSILISVTLGISIYALTVFFITDATGFYLTARFPQYLKKDEISVVDKRSDDILSYMASYSYRGAKYLMSFPNSDDFRNLDSRIENARIPIDIYFIYFLGMLINIIVTAFFVSYAVSIYLMKGSQGDLNQQFTEKQSFLYSYTIYIKEKYSNAKQHVNKSRFM